MWDSSCLVMSVRMECYYSQANAATTRRTRAWLAMRDECFVLLHSGFWLNSVIQQLSNNGIVSIMNPHLGVKINRCQVLFIHLLGVTADCLRLHDGMNCRTLTFWK
jgi:hypothetical protein